MTTNRSALPTRAALTYSWPDYPATEWRSRLTTLIQCRQRSGFTEMIERCHVYGGADSDLIQANGSTQQTGTFRFPDQLRSYAPFQEFLEFPCLLEGLRR